MMALAAFVTACGLTPHGTTRSLPSWCPRDACPGIPADVPKTGVLGGTGECLWIDTDGILASTLWPPKYTASVEPIVVYDEAGKAVFHPGDVISAVMFGPTKLDHPDGCGLINEVALYIDATSAPR